MPKCINRYICLKRMGHLLIHDEDDSDDVDVVVVDDVEDDYDVVDT